ncbi:hypothetical protein Gotri_004220 [Gossypium trilobum]|uniref:Uncharacterized protein n=2 Tax=Gossypium TaxID=3633 RepID=A0A7J9F449_9ROSI|nr:hypothetical protein [Gossypium davidsonii]MBA0780079.1 hypothetical protein [Gossypium trilobum]
MRQFWICSTYLIKRSRPSLQFWLKHSDP